MPHDPETADLWLIMDTLYTLLTKPDQQTLDLLVSRMQDTRMLTPTDTVTLKLFDPARHTDKPYEPTEAEKLAQQSMEAHFAARMKSYSTACTGQMCTTQCMPSNKAFTKGL